MTITRIVGFVVLKSSPHKSSLDPNEVCTVSTKVSGEVVHLIKAAAIQLQYYLLMVKFTITLTLSNPLYVL